MTDEAPRRTGEPQHYFSRQPDVPGRARTLRLSLSGRDLEVISESGVFSAERLDLGTRVLLREVPDPPGTGHLLDLGCGWGPLALAMAIRSPQAQVWAVDVNERAVGLTARNAERAGLAGIRACTPDQVPEELRFAAIWSNPPIRVGKPALHALMLRWLPRLEAGGEAYLVVQRNLGADSLHTWLAEGLGPVFEVARVGSAKGFRVLRVRRQGPAVAG